MKSLLSNPVVRVIVGLLIGVFFLFLVSRFVSLVASIDVVIQNLKTPYGILMALLSGVAFLLAFSIRGVRWRLFLRAVSPVKPSTTVRVYLVGIFVNFLLSFSSGEIVKTLLLKRIAGIPINRSLPTVAMDRSLDLLPALVIMIVVPFWGITMGTALWIVLGIVGGVFVGLTTFTGLTIWKRSAAMTILHKITRVLPSALGRKIEAFATGFVDSLLASASRPRIFLFAMALTCLAVVCDSLFAMFAFWTIGLPISFGTAIFGYTVYNMFFILPTVPGQVGSNEAVGLLIFGGLLHLPANDVAAMFIFSHPWAALLMCSTALICLKTLGLRFSTMMKATSEDGLPESIEETLVVH
jgi:uncharacterized protein (TIRG00374 family)